MESAIEVSIKVGLIRRFLCFHHREASFNGHIMRTNNGWYVHKFPQYNQQFPAMKRTTEKKALLTLAIIDGWEGNAPTALLCISHSECFFRSFSPDDQGWLQQCCIQQCNFHGYIQQSTRIFTGQHIRRNKRRPRHSVHLTLPHFHLLLTEYCVRVVVWFQIAALCRRTQSISHHVGTAKWNARYVVQVLPTLTLTNTQRICGTIFKINTETNLKPANHRSLLRSTTIFA